MKMSPNKFLKIKRLKRLAREFIFSNIDIKKWEHSKMIDVPPHAIKRKLVDEYRKKYNSKILVETGTYLGDMVFFNRNKFPKIYSIELSKDLAENAKKLFKNKKNIEILQGDSSEKLLEIMPKINSKALFWLDGHYSGGLTAKGSLNCPILKELEIIFNNNTYKNIILIDDANIFNGTNDYPSVETVESIATTNGYTCYLKDNSFILEPKI